MPKLATPPSLLDPRLNRAPDSLDPAMDLPEGFLGFLLPLHRDFTPRQQALVSRRSRTLRDAHRGHLPDHLPRSEATLGEWRVTVPEWCRDQRNQMTGPADDAELVVKMLNSGAPGVMIDLEDSMANTWPHLVEGIQNAVRALHGTLSYHDEKRNVTVGIRPSGTVIFVRPRGLHLNQAGVIPGELMSASLFDVASVVYRVAPSRLRHPLTIYIPKSESAEEALWWRDLFRALALAKGLPADAIKCMALVESHPLAYQIEEFAYNLRDHLLGLNLGRWDYLASLIHFTFENPAWVLPDRNSIPTDAPFFQNLRHLLPEICHRRGLLAIGGMTALFPSRVDSGLNARALEALERDKHNEAECLFDGAWTGHPDQNEIAVRQFPVPNQLERRRPNETRNSNLRPKPNGVGTHSLDGTRAAVRTVIRYRFGVLRGRGASLLDGYMEDLATDRIYRLMIAQRVRHGVVVEGVPHTPALVTQLFDEALDAIVRELPAGTEPSVAVTYRLARLFAEEMITRGEFDPV